MEPASPELPPLQLSWDPSEAPKSSVDSVLNLDHLGPMIVNSDGTVSRIANWDKMTEREQQVGFVCVSLFFLYLHLFMFYVRVGSL